MQHVTHPFDDPEAVRAANGQRIRRPPFRVTGPAEPTLSPINGHMDLRCRMSRVDRRSLRPLGGLKFEDGLEFGEWAGAHDDKGGCGGAANFAPLEAVPSVSIRLRADVFDDSPVVCSQLWRGGTSRAASLPAHGGVHGRPYASTWSPRTQTRLPILCWCRDGALIFFAPPLSLFFFFFFSLQHSPNARLLYHFPI